MSRIHPKIQDILSRRPPFGLRPAVYLSFAALAVAAVFAYRTEVEEIVTVPGTIVWSSPKIVITSPDLATVESIDVTVARRVRKGEVLARLRSLEAEATYKALQVEAMHTAAKIARLRIDLDEGNMQENPPEELLAIGREIGVPEAMVADVWSEQRLQFVRQALSHRAEMHAIDDQVARLQDQRVVLDENIALLTKRIPIYNEIENLRRDLYGRQLSSRLELLRAEEQRLQSESDVVTTRRALSQAIAEESRLRGAQSNVETTRENRLSAELETALRERGVVEARLRVEGDRAKLGNLVAPEDAIVLQRADRAPGSVVQKGEHILTMIPEKGDASVELSIPARDIARVKGHTDARVKFDSLPFQRHGYLSGKITRVTGDAVPKRNDENGQSELVYLAHADIEPEPKLRNVPDNFLPLPGMPVSAEVIVGKRTLLSYFTYQFEALGARALREPVVESGPAK